MSLNALACQLKHLPGKHTQQSHNPHVAKQISATELAWVNTLNEWNDKRNIHGFPIIPDNWQVFEFAKGIKKTGVPKHCYANALSVIQDDDRYDLGLSLLIDADSINRLKKFDPAQYWTPSVTSFIHAFPVNRTTGKAEDITFGSGYMNDGSKAIGIVIPRAEVIAKFSVNGTLKTDTTSEAHGPDYLLENYAYKWLYNSSPEPKVLAIPGALDKVYAEWEAAKSANKR